MRKLTREMSLYDRLHPRCREAIRNAPFNFNLLGLPGTALNHAGGHPRSRAAPAAFLAFLAGEVEEVRKGREVRNEQHR